MSLEATFWAGFAKPDFDLLAKPGVLAHKLFEKLSFRTVAGAMHLHPGDGALGDAYFSFPLPLIHAVGAIRLGGFDLNCKPRMNETVAANEVAATALDILDAIRPNAKPTDYSEFRATLVYNCVLPMDVNAKDLLSKYVSAPKLTFGEYRGAGAAFYFRGGEHGHEHTTVTLDRTSLDNGLLVRVVASSDPRVLVSLESLKTEGPERLADIFRQLSEVEGIHLEGLSPQEGAPK